MQNLIVFSLVILVFSLVIIDHPKPYMEDWQNLIKVDGAWRKQNKKTGIDFENKSREVKKLFMGY